MQSLHDPDSQLCIESDKEKLTGIANMGTCILVEMSTNDTADGGWFIYKQKSKLDGYFLKRKVSCVFKAYQSNQHSITMQYFLSLETFISKPSLGLEQGRKKNRNECYKTNNQDKVTSGYDPPLQAQECGKMNGWIAPKIRCIMLARTKSCYRRGPSICVEALRFKQRKESSSNHSSPLEAKCLECNVYRKWNEKMNGWTACAIGCYEDDIQVQCTICFTNAVLNKKLNQWCCQCEMTEGKPVRRRKVTNRFLL